MACREMRLFLSLELLGAFVGGLIGLISCCHAAGDGKAWGGEAGEAGDGRSAEQSEHRHVHPPRLPADVGAVQGAPKQ